MDPRGVVKTPDSCPTITNNSPRIFQIPRGIWMILGELFVMVGQESGVLTGNNMAANDGFSSIDADQ